MTNEERFLNDFQELESFEKNGDIWNAKLVNHKSGPISRVSPVIIVCDFEDTCNKYGYDIAKNIIISYIKEATTYYFDNGTDKSETIRYCKRYLHIISKGDLLKDKIVLKSSIMDSLLRCPAILNRNDNLGIFTYSRIAYLLFNDFIKIYEDYISVESNATLVHFASTDDNVIKSKNIQIPIMDCVIPVVNNLFPDKTQYDDIPGFYFICSILRSALKVNQAENKVFSKGILNNTDVKNKIYKMLDDKLIDYYRQTDISIDSQVFKSGKFPIRIGILDVDKDMTLSEYELFVFNNWVNNSKFESF